MQVAESLRDEGLDVILHCGSASFKSQMKRADASGAEVAVILGEDELRNGTASVKYLRGAQQGQQQSIPQEALGQTLVAALTEATLV